MCLPRLPGQCGLSGFSVICGSERTSTVSAHECAGISPRNVSSIMTGVERKRGV